MNRIDAGRPDIGKLRQYGFSGDNGVLRYSETLGCGFALTFEVRDGELFAGVFDDGEEYVLHLTDASGEFVGRVRKEYEDAVSRVTSACFERAVYSPYFRSGQTARLIADAEKIWGETPEFLWEDSPDCCILRNRESGKWYAVFMVVPLAKFFPGTEGKTEVVNLRADAAAMSDGERVFPAFHMNKKSWISVLADRGKDYDVILALMRASRETAAKKAGKKNSRQDKTSQKEEGVSE